MARPTIHKHSCSGRVVACLTGARQDPGSIPTAGGSVHHDSHRDRQANSDLLPYVNQPNYGNSLWLWSRAGWRNVMHGNLVSKTVSSH